MLRLGRLVFRSEDPGGRRRSPHLVSTPALLQPLPLRGLTLPNRMVVAPMCQYSVTEGLVGDYHLVHLGRFALGGVGPGGGGAAGGARGGPVSPGDAGLWVRQARPRPGGGGGPPPARGAGP